MLRISTWCLTPVYVPNCPVSTHPNSKIDQKSWQPCIVHIHMEASHTLFHPMPLPRIPDQKRPFVSLLHFVFLIFMLSSYPTAAIPCPHCADSPWQGRDTPWYTGIVKWRESPEAEHWRYSGSKIFLYRSKHIRRGYICPAGSWQKYFIDL